MTEPAHPLSPKKSRWPRSSASCSPTLDKYFSSKIWIRLQVSFESWTLPAVMVKSSGFPCASTINMNLRCRAAGRPADALVSALGSHCRLMVSHCREPCIQINAFDLCLSCSKSSVLEPPWAQRLNLASTPHHLPCSMGKALRRNPLASA